MTPHQYWITQGKGMERPFTGKLWFEQDVGYYHCSVCKTRLFDWNQKFKTTNGMASFWSSLNNSVTIKDDNMHEIEEDFTNVIQNNIQKAQQSNKKKACCAKCDSFLGLVFFDGPPPTFKRFSINSGAVDFIKKPHWIDPNYSKKVKETVGAANSQEEQLRKRKVYEKQNTSLIQENEQQQ